MTKEQTVWEGVRGQYSRWRGVDEASKRIIGQTIKTGAYKTFEGLFKSLQLQVRKEIIGAALVSELAQRGAESRSREHCDGS